MNGSIAVQNDSITSVSARPTSAACDSTSRSNSVLPAIVSVSRIISCATSSVAPSRHSRAHPIRVGHHRPAVAGDALAVKRRLHQPPLAQVIGAFARQQAVAEQPLRPIESAALHEAAVVRDEDVLDRRRVVDEEHLLARHPVGREVAVGARQAGEERNRIGAGAVNELTERGKLRSWRERDGLGHDQKSDTARPRRHAAVNFTRCVERIRRRRSARAAAPRLRARPGCRAATRSNSSISSVASFRVRVRRARTRARSRQRGPVVAPAASSRARDALAG